MTSLKRELGGIALVVLIAASGRVHAQTLTPSSSDQPSSDPNAPVGCPSPSGQQAGACPQPQTQPQAQDQYQQSGQYQQTGSMAPQEGSVVEEQPWYKTVGVA